LLLVTCVWIIYEAINRLFFKDVAVESSIWGFLVMGISIVIDVSRSRVLMHAAKKYKSQALEADALHFSTDVWSSSVVIGGLALVLVSEKFNAPWLVKADAIAALVVAMIVVYVSIQLGKRTIDGLLDTAPHGLVAQIEERVRQVAGVEEVGEVRVRASGPELFADVTIGVNNSLPLAEAHNVAVAVEEAVRTVVPESDVMVHTDPHDDTEGIFHNVAVQRIGGHVQVVYDLEVAPDLSLGEAHDLASRLEHRLRADIAEIARIDTHIEPRVQTETAGHDVTAQSPEIVAAVKDAIAGLPLISGYHNITVLQTDDRYSVSVHCTFAPSMPIREVHHVSDLVSERVKLAAPSVSRVVVHSEP
jgi:cation diffusion facilitator family transporter